MSRGIVTPTLTASLDVECPYCGEWFNLFDNDDDNVYQGAIFNNNWGALETDEHHCPKCEAELTIDEVDY